MKIEYNNLYTHFIFTTFQRQPIIEEKNRVRIEKYVTGIIHHYESHLYSIYANPEHMHFLVSRSPAIAEVDLATIVANSSERFINKNNLCSGRFTWQDSAAAFSVSKSHVDPVCKYILNQPFHHRRVSFAEEYDALIKFYEKAIYPVHKSLKVWGRG